MFDSVRFSLIDWETEKTNSVKGETFDVTTVAAEVSPLKDIDVSPFTLTYFSR